MTVKFLKIDGIGIDEVGKGAVAGPVVAAAVLMLSNEDQIKSIGIDDSKTLTKRKREIVNQKLIDLANLGILQYGIGVVTPEEIDKNGIVISTNKAMRIALEKLNYDGKLIIVDGIINPFKGEILQVETIVRGDALSYNVGAASIIAKVFRDKLMDDLSKGDLTCYNWRKNKGYASAEHIKAIKLHGLSQHHRQSFCKNFIYYV